MLEYPDHIRWRKKIGSDVFSNYGKSDVKKIRQLLKSMESYEIEVSIAELNEPALSSFLAMYKKKFDTENDIRGKISRQQNPESPYQMLTLSQRGAFLGGIIFRFKNDALYVAFRVFEKEWGHESPRCSPALFAEFQLDVYAHHKSVFTIIHGKDRNLYGQDLKIGLAVFKLSIGCFPEPSRSSRSKSLDIRTLQQDTLVFHSPPEGQRITDATLFLLPNSQAPDSVLNQLQKYTQVFTLHTQTL